MKNPLKLLINLTLLTCIGSMNLGCFNCERYYARKKKIVIKGLIVNKFTSSNHAEPILEIKNSTGEVIQGAYFQLFDLWTAAQTGDSIYKAANSLQYCLIKRDTIICFYPECNGSKIE